MEEMLSEALKSADDKIEDEKFGKVIARFTLPPDLKKLREEGKILMEKGKDILKKDLAETLGKSGSLGKKFWAEVELRSGYYVNTMKISKNNESEVLIYESEIDSI